MHLQGQLNINGEGALELHEGGEFALRRVLGANEAQQNPQAN